MTPKTATTAAGAEFRLWHTTFRVTTDDPDVTRDLARLCRQFAHADGEAEETFDVERTPGGAYEIHRNGAVVDRAETALRAATRLEWQMVSAAVAAENEYVHFHGAALTRAGRTVLIPGRSGIGKSTLALALACNGFELLGDDIVFVDPTSLRTHPFPRALHVHDNALPLLARAGFEYQPERHLGQYLEAKALRSWRREPAGPISTVLFVEWDAGGAVETLPMTQAEVAVELGRFSKNLRQLPEFGLPMLQRLLAPTRNLRVLRTQDLAAAVRVIREFVDRTPPTEVDA